MNKTAKICLSGYTFRQEELSYMEDNIIIVDTSMIEAPKPGNTLYETRRNFADSYKVFNNQIAISIIAYNRLEKTKKCIEYLFKYTSHIDFELILCDNGSTDGTFEFFKSIDYPKKKIVRITKNLGAFFAANLIIDMAKCKYYVAMTNDAYVTENWLDNLLKCIESDDRIAYVSPMSSNMSNNQDPGLKFSSLEEMEIVASQFNKSDPRKWMERKRIVGVLACYRKDALDQIGKYDPGFFHEFSDDDFAFRVTRAGYKLVLCGDTFIHHDHAVFNMEDKDPETTKQSLRNGRKNFKDKYYGIDSWEDLLNFETPLINMASYENSNGENNVLGIDTKCGIPILEIKNKLRFNGADNIKLYAFTTKAKYYNDLLHTCEGNVNCDRIEFLNEYYVKDSFDYIILGEALNSYKEPFKLLENIIDLLQPSGQAVIKLKNTLEIRTLLSLYGHKQNFFEELLIHLSIDDVIAFLNQKNISDVKLSGITYNVDNSINTFVNNTASSVGISPNSLGHLYINEYLIYIKK